jgi:hypothetical protein
MTPLYGISNAKQLKNHKQNHSHKEIFIMKSILTALYNVLDSLVLARDAAILARSGEYHQATKLYKTL